MFEGKESVRTIKIREDYRLNGIVLNVDEWCNEVITQFKGAKRDAAWFVLHQLMKPVYGFPGIPDGELALLVNNRDAVPLDPLNQLDESWKPGNLIKNTYPFKEMAKEQQYKADASNTGGFLANSQLVVSISAGIVVLAAAIVGILKYYGG